MMQLIIDDVKFHEIWYFSPTPASHLHPHKFCLLSFYPKNQKVYPTVQLQELCPMSCGSLDGRGV